MEEQLKNKAILEAKNACLLASHAIDRARHDATAAAAATSTAPELSGSPSRRHELESPRSLLGNVRATGPDQETANLNMEELQTARRLNGILAAQVRHLCAGWRNLSGAAMDLAGRCLGLCREGSSGMRLRSAGACDDGLQEMEEAECEVRLGSLRKEFGEWDKLTTGFTEMLGESP